MSAAADKQGYPPAWTLAASILASSLAFVDGSVTNVARVEDQRGSFSATFTSNRR